ncbi:MAG: guanitoxin biosynthesis pre-guanitoxin forming N-methyltransferase GntF [Myxococcota bacterium]
MTGAHDQIEDNFTTWVPADYLREYYQRLDPDEHHAIRFFVEAQRDAPPGPVLCFGSGPTLHHVFSAARHTSALYLADYLPRNLSEIDRWRRREPGAHDWRPFVRYTLECEFGRAATEAEVTAREELTRSRIAGLLHADASLQYPLGRDFHQYFATVLSPFCADSITSDRAVWATYSRNIASLVKPGGRFLTTALRNCQRYRVGPRYFPSANIDESHLRDVLEQDFLPASVRVEIAEVPELADHGYSAILLARADKAGTRERS